MRKNVKGIEINSAREDRYGVVVDARVFYERPGADTYAARLKKAGHRVRVQPRSVRSNNVEIYLYVVTAREAPRGLAPQPDTR